MRDESSEFKKTFIRIDNDFGHIRRNLASKANDSEIERLNRLIVDLATK